MSSLASIEIIKDGGKITAVKVIMPTWNNLNYDGQVQIKAPFLGIETFVESEDRVEVAIREAVTCLVIGAEKFGQGFEKELIAFGWEPTKDSVFEITTEKEYFDSVLATGDTAALELEMA